MLVKRKVALLSAHSVGIVRGSPPHRTSAAIEFLPSSVKNDPKVCFAPDLDAHSFAWEVEGRFAARSTAKQRCFRCLSSGALTFFCVLQGHACFFSVLDGSLTSHHSAMLHTTKRAAKLRSAYRLQHSPSVRWTPPRVFCPCSPRRIITYAHHRLLSLALSLFPFWFIQTIANPPTSFPFEREELPEVASSFHRYPGPAARRTSSVAKLLGEHTLSSADRATSVACASLLGQLVATSERSTTRR